MTVPRFDDDPPGIPLEHVGRLGLTWFIDTNIIGDGTPAVTSLLKHRSEGWVRLVKADTLDTELSADSDPDRSARLADESGSFEEMFGPAVWGHSRWGHAVWAAPEDLDHIETVFAVIFPYKDRAAANKNDVRDGLHVATAIRYGADGFVTRDRKGPLRATDAVRAAYNGFHIMSPEKAVEVAERLIARSLEVRRRAQTALE